MTTTPNPRSFERTASAAAFIRAVHDRDEEAALTFARTSTTEDLADLLIGTADIAAFWLDQVCKQYPEWSPEDELDSIAVDANANR